MVLFLSFLVPAAEPEPEKANPTAGFASAAFPGKVIAYSPRSSGLYVGSPSLIILTNGDYLASHDHFGPKSEEHSKPNSFIYRSSDRGQTWSRVAKVEGAFWSNLFVHRGAVYLLGADKHHGRIVIRRCTDGGETWTSPVSETTGLLTPVGQYHTAPVPVVEHEGRLWRAFENAGGGTEWGKRYQAGMLSIEVDADLLNATNWVFSNWLSRDPGWLGGGFKAWLEGNAVIAPSGRVVNILRVDTPGLPEMAAIVQVSRDGKVVSFDSSSGFIPFRGGAKKFTIRHDPQSGLYWSMVTIARPEDTERRSPASVRNTLALASSADLKTWEVKLELLHHPDVAKHGFQYVDWQFEGGDIIAACRTAFDDPEGGANNNHDANYLTFHRIKEFRQTPR